jgi:hypothetical protein
MVVWLIEYFCMVSIYHDRGGVLRGGGGLDHGIGVLNLSRWLGMPNFKQDTPGDAISYSGCLLSCLFHLFAVCMSIWWLLIWLWPWTMHDSDLNFSFVSNKVVKWILLQLLAIHLWLNCKNESYACMLIWWFPGRCSSPCSFSYCEAV